LPQNCWCTFAASPSRILLRTPNRPYARTSAGSEVMQGIQSGNGCTKAPDENITLMNSFADTLRRRGLAI
jgi:hypothetical protein